VGGYERGNKLYHGSDKKRKNSSIVFPTAGTAHLAELALLLTELVEEEALVCHLAARALCARRAHARHALLRHRPVRHLHVRVHAACAREPGATAQRRQGQRTAMRKSRIVILRFGTS
jgi:hypothetical protein